METGIDLLNLVFTAAAEGIIISDRSGKITSANPMAEQIFGYGKRELEGKGIDELVPKTISHKHEALRTGYFKNPHPRPMGKGFDLYGLKKNGDTFPLEISLSHFVFADEPYVVAFITDITARKQNEEKLKQYTTELQSKVKERTQELEHLNLGLRKEVMERRVAERALQKSQKLYETVAKNFPNGTISLLDRDLKYEFSEGKGHREKEGLIGRKFSDTQGYKQVKNLEELLDEVLSGKEASFEFSNEKGTLLTHLVPILDDQDQVDRIVVVEEDITEIKRAEREALKLLEKERELNEMKSRFVSMASHEFRTPLTTILSSTDLIGKYTETDQQDRRTKHLDRIRSSVKNLTEILNDFLSLEKLESGAIEVHHELIDLHSFTATLLEELAPIKKSGQEFIFSGEEVEISTDHRLLKNILINLISNAIKYSAEDKPIRVGLTPKTDEVSITITDEGMGIPEEEQKSLFQRFFRAKNAFNIQGTGLGLHIVEKYVTLLNGKIDLKSKLGEGTSVTITLPNDK